MRRKLVCVMFAVLVMTGGILQVQAAGKTGSVSVTLDYGDERLHNGSITLYYVGSASEEGYVLTDAFGGGLIKREDAQSAALAKWLAETAEGMCVPRILDADHNAHFSDLPEGLYLLVQSEHTDGYADIAPFLIPMPCYGQWEVTALPKVQKLLTESPQTGQHPTPLVAAMILILSGMGLMICGEKFRKK